MAQRGSPDRAGEGGRGRLGKGLDEVEFYLKCHGNWQEDGKGKFFSRAACGQMGKHMGAIDLIHMITFHFLRRQSNPVNGFPYSKLRTIRYINYFFLMKFLEGGIE